MTSTQMRADRDALATPHPMEVSFAAFASDFYAKHPRTWSSLADTLDDYPDDRDPADDAMYFRAAPRWELAAVIPLAEQFAAIFGAPMPADQIAAEVDAMHAVASFDTINAYFADHRPFEAEREVERTRCHAAIDAGMACLNAEQQRCWAAEEQSR